MSLPDMPNIHSSPTADATAVQCQTVICGLAVGITQYKWQSHQDPPHLMWQQPSCVNLVRFSPPTLCIPADPHALHCKGVLGASKHGQLNSLLSAGITDFFDEIQIIPYTQKDTTHFPKIRKALDVPYQRMLFFDDENGNIARVQASLQRMTSLSCRCGWSTSTRCCSTSSLEHCYDVGQVSRLGVTSILVSTATGVNVEAFRRGLREHMTGR